MKTINIFVLQECAGDGGSWENVRITTNEQEANEWFEASDYNSYEKYEVVIPQEIQVQRDY